MEAGSGPDNYSKPEDAAQFITVSDPVQHSEGMNKYTSFRVDVRPPPQPNDGTNPDGSSTNPDDVFQNAGYSAVLRRYSDFLWLYDRLQKERAGAIVPPIPEKQAVSRFSAVFVEERRIHLERFVRRVAVHPELYDAPSLDTFLRADDVTFHAAKTIKGSSADAMMMSMSAMPNAPSYMNTNPAMSMSGMPIPPPPKKDGIKKWFAETKASIAGDLVRSPDDDLFLEIDRYIEGLEKQMKNVQSQASGLVRKGKEIANGLFEFGMAFNILGQSEADDLGNALTKMGSAADELSNVSMQHAEKEMAQFEEPLKDYLKTIHAVKLALTKRHDRRLTYTTYLSEVNTKRGNLAKLRMTPGAEAKACGAEMSLKRGEANAERAREEFATVSQRVLREVDRFKREKGDEMRRVVLDYINLQIEYNKKMEQVWAELLPKLEVVQNPGGAVGGSNGSNYSNQGIPSNVVTDVPVENEVHELSQPQQPHVYSGVSNMNNGVGQNMLGLEGSVQYRDNTNFPISGMLS
mmetsp:Transcript_10586/g.15466  ORF Transcript_10586/g.15466 Transcript_10586/m.15466 type:complete len:519 (-) Transcript_10586:75-1631(-)|eukprot:CAMPEP_0197239678 /NCGR_PEP_ID=MMETSP1429-20130617/6121_1 /TAXON_ID=49237 /ORGANISM="Chaetoceros  sp., Strain UNC1202" /LENGTH=518 /DNA_ID=CAMNT_0042699145 /DNA_START=17 /DNA_END=1573 /DNA_ORIENTATION=+